MLTEHDDSRVENALLCAEGYFFTALQKHPQKLSAQLSLKADPQLNVPLPLNVPVYNSHLLFKWKSLQPFAIVRSSMTEASGPLAH